MKKVKYLFLLLPMYGILMIGIQACKKSYLDRIPQGSFLPATLANDPGVQGLLVGAYAKLRGNNDWGSSPTDWGFGSASGGDSYKGSTPADQSAEGLLDITLWSLNSTNGYVSQKWNALYDGAQRANEVLRVMALATDITDANKKLYGAEARFLRGYYHLEAKMIWRNPIYVDETITYSAGNGSVPNVDGSGNFIDIWPKIEADFQNAIDNLPGTASQRGRGNKWAAMAFLVKAYMMQHKYAQAKPLLDQLIASGTTAGGQKYALVNYEDNFNAATDNSPESVFAVQYSVNDGSGTNGRYGDNLNMPNGGVYGCCGFNNPSATLANAFKTDATGLPLLDTYNAGNNVSDPTTPYVGTLDPRIDWVMGRPGIPYFDFGPHPGAPWIRDPATNGYFSPKKNVYSKAQVGALASTETSFWGPTQMDANNYDIIRYADILLWAAEVDIETGTGANALTYVNLLRSRAADPTGWVYKNSDYDAAIGKYKTQTTPADNYKVGLYSASAFTDKNYARKALRHEYFIEFGMEGRRFFNLQRWDNGTGYMAQVLNDYAAAEKTRASIYKVNTGAAFDRNKDEYRPIPLGQIDAENSGGKINLKQDPAYN